MLTPLPITDAQRSAGWLPAELPMLRQLLTTPVARPPQPLDPPGGYDQMMRYIHGNLLKCPAIAGSVPLSGMIEEWHAGTSNIEDVASSPIRAPFDKWWAEFYDPLMKIFGGIYFERDLMPEGGERIRGDVFVWQPGHYVNGPSAVWILNTDGDGKLIDMESMAMVEADSPHREDVQATAARVGIPLTALIALLGRNNIQLATGKLSNAEARRFKPRQEDDAEPRWEYKFVTVTNIHGQKRKNASGGGGPERMEAWHIVRGCEKVYGYDGNGLLFGKLRGRFWCYPHERGDKRYGIIHKDYRIGA
ncbi:MAG TPA: hypothetical protein VHY37_07185 [Tepidisphaeraceae bacterium]|jgi:hypothetical protein|nr:hypothetical protein [Tepidisphaeraceae bacterium]